MGMLALLAGCSIATSNSDRKSADVAVLDALPTFAVIDPVGLLSTEIEQPPCVADCPAPARFWFYGCNNCRVEIEDSVGSMIRELQSAGWELVSGTTGSGVVTLSRDDPDSRTGAVIIQILWSHGQGLIREHPRITIDGTESEIWVRASTEGFDA